MKDARVHSTMVYSLIHNSSNLYAFSWRPSSFLRIGLIVALWQLQLPRCPISVAGASVEPVSSVCDLGVFIDSDLGAATHVRRTVSWCFAVLRQLRHLRRYATYNCFRSLVMSLVHSRLDYCNFIFVGLPICNDASRPYLTLQLVCCSDVVATTT